MGRYKDPKIRHYLHLGNQRGDHNLTDCRGLSYCAPCDMCRMWGPLQKHEGAGTETTPNVSQAPPADLDLDEIPF